MEFLFRVRDASSQSFSNLLPAAAACRGNIGLGMQAGGRGVLLSTCDPHGPQVPQQEVAVAAASRKDVPIPHQGRGKCACVSDDLRTYNGGVGWIKVLLI